MQANKSVFLVVLDHSASNLLHQMPTAGRPGVLSNRDFVHFDMILIQPFLSTVSRLNQLAYL